MLREKLEVDVGLLHLLRSLVHEVHEHSAHHVKGLLHVLRRHHPCFALRPRKRHHRLGLLCAGNGRVALSQSLDRRRLLELLTCDRLGRVCVVLGGLVDPLG